MEFNLCFIFFILGIIAGIVIVIGRCVNVFDCWIDDDILFDSSECGAGFRHGRIYLAVTDDIVSFIDKKTNKEYMYDKRSHSFKECKDQKEKMNIAIKNRKYDNLKRWKEEEENKNES